MFKRIPSSGRRNAPPRLWYHLTDHANFRPNPRYAPEDNALAIEDRSGRPGIYLAPEVERWVNGQGYWRPFVAEFEVDPTVFDDPGVHGRWAGERFIPAASFSKLRLLRVIPLDAYARETFSGAPGWVETALGVAFDTGEPLPKPGWNAPVSAHYPFRGYRYPGPDVREMSREQVAGLKGQMRRFLKLKRAGRAVQEELRN